MRWAITVLVAGCGFHTAASAGDAAGEGSPRIDAPSGDAPMIDAPMIDAPMIDAPMIDAPMIDAPPGPEVIVEAEATSQITKPGTLMWSVETSKPGFSGASYMALSGSGQVCPATMTDTILACSAAMFYDVNVPTAGPHTFHIRMWADSGSNDSAFVTVDDPTAVSAVVVGVVGDSTWHWTKVATPYTVVAGPHRLGIWHREGGARVDRLAFTISSAPPP
jgi:hypothetical protein